MSKAVDQSLYASVAGGGIMFRNRFINGGFRINQRGSVPASVGGSYGPDRWIGAISGGSAISGNFVSSAYQPSVGGYGAYLSGVSFTNGTPYFAQRIEALNTVDLSGGQVTVSGKIYQDSGSTMNWSVRLVKPNTTDNYGSVTYLTAVQNIMIPSGAVTPFTATFTLGSTDAANGLAVEIYGTSVFTAVTKTFAIADMQIEKGSVATPFEFRPYGTELALCQRYAWVPDGNAGVAGVASVSTISVMRFVHPVQMRAAPTASIQTAGSFTISDDYSGDFTAASVSISGSSISQNVSRLSLSGFTGLTQGRYYGGLPGGAWTSRILLSSEL